MKKKDFSFSLPLFASILPLIIQQPAAAQVPSPAEWPRFVTSTANPAVRDTFLLQTFSETPEDNWAYTTIGTAERFDASAEGIANQRDSWSLRLKPGSRISFAPFNIEAHTDVRINLPFGARQLTKGENLLLSARRASGNLNRYPAFVVPSAPFNGDFPADRPGSPRFIQLTSNPTSLDLEVATATGGQGGFYAIDLLYAHGSIPEYTLFTGTGNWQDKARWSHAPALRHRTALINGESIVDTAIKCERIYIGTGKLRITPEGRLHLNNLTLDIPAETTKTDAPALLAEGELHIAGRYGYRRTFAEKGKWYFISFPFDVYPEGIDPAFRLGDDTPNGGGNFFYIQTYNGRKRALSGIKAGNWETIPSSATMESRPLFERYKGYLIALDAQASANTLHFYSREGEKILPDGNEYRIPVEATLAPAGADDPDSGWYLCGNPLPGPLPLSQIASNGTTDGFIYVYEDGTYKGYAFGSQAALPASGAFFIKAKGDTDLHILPTVSPNTPTEIIPLAAVAAKEPENKKDTPTGIPATAGQKIGFRIQGNRLSVEGVPAPGIISLNDGKGRLIYRKEMPAGTSVHFIEGIQQGMYVLTAEGKGYCITSKQTIR